MKLVPLKDLGSIYTGNTPSKNERKFYEAKDIPFIKPDIISDSKLSEITHTEEYISNLARNNARIIPKNSILVTCIGSIGKIGITGPGEYAFNQQINAIVPNDGINVRYFAYCLLFNKKKLCEIANNAVVPIINKKQFSDFCVNINPDIKVQKDIVRTLDILACIIKHRQSQLMKLDELVKCRFVEMFGDPTLNPFNWKIVPLSSIIRGNASNGYFAKREEYCQLGNVQVLGVANVVNRMYSSTYNLPRAKATDKDIKKYHIKYGDMLFCRSSLVAEGIGKASIVPPNIPKNTLFECHVIRISLDLSQCVPEYIQVLSTDFYFRKQVIAQSKTATMTTISQDGILKCCVPLPPLELQKEFLTFTHRVDKLRFVIQQSLDETQKLFDSLMQEYFD